MISEEVKDRGNGKNVEMQAGNTESSKPVAIHRSRCFRDLGTLGRHPWTLALHLIVTGSELQRLHHASRGYAALRCQLIPIRLIVSNHLMVTVWLGEGRHCGYSQDEGPRDPCLDTLNFDMLITSTLGLDTGSSHQ